MKLLKTKKRNGKILLLLLFALVLHSQGLKIIFFKFVIFQEKIGVLLLLLL